MHLYLSPHYDDAVYSCGGQIAKLVAAGEEVLIWTLMAGVPSLPLPDTPVLQDNHQRWQAGENPMQQRREEDQNAAKILGASVQYADLLDCIYRTANGDALYATEDSLWGDIHPDDPAQRQLHALELPPITHLYAPLAVGDHVDHKVVRDWALEIAVMKPDFAVAFYTDYPYLRDAEAIAHALEQIPFSLQPETVHLDESNMQTKIAAMKAYRSQISSFWDDESSVAAEVRETFTLPEGGYGERLYTIP